MGVCLGGGGRGGVLPKGENMKHSRSYLMSGDGPRNVGEGNPGCVCACVHVCARARAKCILVSVQGGKIACPPEILIKCLGGAVGVVGGGGAQSSMWHVHAHAHARCLGSAWEDGAVANMLANLLAV